MVDLLNRRPRAVLMGYWAIAFIVTHVPPFLPPGPPEPEALIGKDKFAHFFGFAFLAFLLMNALRNENRLLKRAGLPDSMSGAVVVTVAICMVYAAIDELTQPPFGRTADPWDYVADLIGMTAGILAFHLWKPRCNATLVGQKE